MSTQVIIDDLGLAALISSRICHDAIGPVGAIGNGLEVLEDGRDEETREFALDTIKKSADKASASLQFARLAFGAAGSSAMEIPINDVSHVAHIFVDGGKHKLNWNVTQPSLPKEKVKLLLNMIAIALTALPLGGTISVSVNGAGAASNLLIACQGNRARIPENVPELLAGRFDGSLDSRSVQPFYTGRIARQAGISIKIAMAREDVILRAE